MNVRRLALAVLTDVTDGGAYANLRLKQAQAGLPEADARFLAALVYGTLERLLYLDHVLAAYAPGRAKKAVRGILRLGACELLFLRTPPHAAVSEYVSLCRALGKGGAAGFVNAVLRRVDRERGTPPPAARGAGRAAVHPVQPSAVAGAHVARGAGPGGDGSACSPARRCRSACARSTRRRPRGCSPRSPAPPNAGGWTQTACALRAGWT